MSVQHVSTAHVRDARTAATTIRIWASTNAAHYILRKPRPAVSHSAFDPFIPRSRLRAGTIVGTRPAIADTIPLPGTLDEQDFMSIMLRV